MLVIAGHDGVGFHPDTWVLDLGGAQPGPWSALGAPGLPPRAFASAVFDPATDRVLLFGGRGASSVLWNDVWALDLASRTWNQVHTAGPPPRPRAGAGLVIDPATGRLLVAGGADDGQAFEDVVALDLTVVPPRWRPVGVATPGPGGRGHGAWFLDQAGDLLVFGGTDPVTGTAGDLWKLDR
jgi:hypothetical protein